mgnify:CR=1 FL=1|jgi:hypothetical protein
MSTYGEPSAEIERIYARIFELEPIVPVGGGVNTAVALEANPSRRQIIISIHSEPIWSAATYRPKLGVYFNASETDIESLIDVKSDACIIYNAAILSYKDEMFGDVFSYQFSNPHILLNPHRGRMILKNHSESGVILYVHVIEY